MKKLLIIAGLIFGISQIGLAQKASVNGIEYKVFKKKTKKTKQITHFEKKKKDKKMKYSGTTYKYQTSNRCVDCKSIKGSKKHKERKQPKIKTNDFY